MEFMKPFLLVSATLYVFQTVRTNSWNAQWISNCCTYTYTLPQAELRELHEYTTLCMDGCYLAYMHAHLHINIIPTKLQLK